jgi:hypothetical protein
LIINQNLLDHQSTAQLAALTRSINLLDHPSMNYSWHWSINLLDHQSTAQLAALTRSINLLDHQSTAQLVALTRSINHQLQVMGFRATGLHRDFTNSPEPAQTAFSGPDSRPVGHYRPEQPHQLSPSRSSLSCPTIVLQDVVGPSE